MEIKNECCLSWFKNSKYKTEARIVVKDIKYKYAILLPIEIELSLAKYEESIWRSDWKIIRIMARINIEKYLKNLFLIDITKTGKKIPTGLWIKTATREIK